MTQPAASGKATISSISFEHLAEALGIGAATPRLSWAVETATEGWRQGAYAIEAWEVDPYGMAECAWRLDGEQITVTATVPPNTSAVVTLPGDEREPLTLDSPIGALIDDADAWGAVTRVLGELAPNLGFIRSSLMAQSAVPLRQALAGLPMGDRLTEAIGRALAEPGRS